jgi:two-component system response regulator FixJ
MQDSPIIFVVDDDKDLRETIADLLELNGFTVETFASGAELLQRQPAPTRGCVISDFRMPSMTGLELQTLLTKSCINLPVIMMTGYADVPLAVAAMKAGAVDFLEKPVANAELLACVKRAVEFDEKLQSERRQEEAAMSRVTRLTPRERQVLAELVSGRSNKMIAFELAISQRTVEVHRARVMRKMEADSLSHLVRMAITAGVTPATA